MSYSKTHFSRDQVLYSKTKILGSRTLQLENSHYQEPTLVQQRKTGLYNKITSLSFLSTYYFTLKM